MTDTVLHTDGSRYCFENGFETQTVVQVSDDILVLLCEFPSEMVIMLYL